MKNDPVIKWSGSKRSQAREIVSLFPHYNNYYEPFLGGGSILYAANPQTAVCGDICRPLIELFKMIQKSPINVINQYSKLWDRLQEQGADFYYEVRDRFNQLEDPCDFLFLTRTCVNGLIRFNDQGKFNNSFHLTRPGIHPSRLERVITTWSRRIKNVKFVNADYRKTTKNARKGDLVYLDPPYFHNKDRYYGKINFNDFIEYLLDLNSRGVNYIISLDGISGEDNRIISLPCEVYTKHLLLPSGIAPFKKVIDKKVLMVHESIYTNFDVENKLDRFLK